MIIEAILFDIDGTLVDSNEQHVLSWEAAFQGIGAGFERQVIHDQIGKGSDMLIPALLPSTDETTRNRLSDAHGEIYKSHFLSGAKPFPGAREILVHAHEAGQKVVLASSASSGEL